MTSPSSMASVGSCRARIGDDAAGFTQLLTLLAEAGDTPGNPVPVAIETDHGLLVSALRTTSRVIYPINPLSASRYRSRHQVSGVKSDAADAVLLANILRTDIAAHHPLPADTELAQAIRVLARARQDAVWSRQQLGNQVRSLLKEFYPPRWRPSPACLRAVLPDATPAPCWQRRHPRQCPRG